MTSWIKKIALLCAATALFACSNGNGNGTNALVDGSGNHPSGWLEKHWIGVAGLKGTAPADAAAAAAGAGLACAECHGRDLSGGISKVSCFSAQQGGEQCHPTTLGHPQDWGHAIQHGQAGAMASAGNATGFAYCSRCHGSDFRGGDGKAVSCFSCHSTAPHPPKPWIGGNLSHATTGPNNAAVCDLCHRGGNNFSAGSVLASLAAPASPPAPAPDCFNNTLCHGGQVNPPHAAGVAFLQGHPSADPGTLSLSACKACHSGATGRFNLPSNNLPAGCEGCHTPFTPHPFPWLPGRVGAAAAPSNPNSTSHAVLSSANPSSDCTPCHGANLTGGVGPSCLSGPDSFGVSCHLSNPKAVPSCTSCHPHDTNGGAQPSTGSHTVHLGLPGVSCDACHSGGGADPVSKLGAGRHADGFLDISSVSYWGRNGGFRYDRQAKTCSNVRCHGGGDPVTHTTPPWNGGSLAAKTGTAFCRQCHEQGNAGNTPQTPEFNSFHSGSFTQAFTPVNLHQFHLDPNNSALFPHLPVLCTDCHTLTTQQHFGALASIFFQSTPGNLPGDTIRIPGVYLKDPVTGGYPGTCSNVACHTVVSPTASWGK